MELSKGSKTDLDSAYFTVHLLEDGGAVDIAAVLLGSNGQVRTDEDFVFFNNPSAAGVTISSSSSISIDLDAVPLDVTRVLVTASTEAQGKRFGDVPNLTSEIRGTSTTLKFLPPGLVSETVLQLVAFYRRGKAWRLDAIGQGYADGLAAFATHHGINVDDPNGSAGPVTAERSANAHSQPQPEVPPTPVDFQKVQISLTKDSYTKTAWIDLRKSQGDPNWVLTVGLEWDGRGATYDRNGRVKKYGSGDLDVYFFCRNEITNKFVVISGETKHRGSLETWPFIHHYGDSKGPGSGSRPATEQVRVKPTENGDLLVNVYQSVDNGTGAIDAFGKPRVAIRYGRAGRDGLPGSDADEILVFVGNSQDSYWATVAHIDVQDGILTVDGDTRYSRPNSERMPGLSTAGEWVQEPDGGPVGRSKKAHRGTGLTKYTGKCAPSE